jgi:hypothetical protein
MFSFCNAQQFIPFSEFLRSTEKATYQDYANTPVRDEHAFLQIKKHILNMYGGVAVPANVRSYLSNHGYTDCILLLEQSSIHLLNLTEEEKTPPQDDEEVDLPDLGSATDGVKGQPIAVSLFGDPQAVDIFGNPQQCLNGTVPQRRLTLDRITRYGTLYEFFAKRPFNSTAPWNVTDTNNGTATRKRLVIDPLGFKHLHQIALDVFETDPELEGYLGAATAMNVWKPNAGFSISQMWLTNRAFSQSIEAGWIVGGPIDDGKPYPFIYYRTSEGSGCYNWGDECPGFVKCSGGHDLRWDQELTPSTFGGRQYELRLVWALVRSQWRLYFQRLDPITNRLYHNHVVGYYPASLFASGEGELRKNAYRIQFGGEVSESLPVRNRYGEMGSGRFARPFSYVENYGQVAYQRAIHVKVRDRNDATETWQEAVDLSSGGEDDAARRCYNSFMGWRLSGAPAGWGMTIFFGGPGGNYCESEDYPRCLALGCPARWCQFREVCNKPGQCVPGLFMPPCCPWLAEVHNANCRRQREQCIAYGCREIY